MSPSFQPAYHLRSICFFDILMTTEPTNQHPHKSPTNSPQRDLYFAKGVWDSSEIRELIDTRSENERIPSHLFLGKREAQLLRQHLRQAFPEQGEFDLQGFRFLGLEIVLHESDSLLRLAGDLYMGHLARTGKHRDPIEDSPSWWRRSG